MKSMLLFTEQAKPFILQAFNKGFDDNGNIVDLSTGEAILTPEGDKLTKENFGGIKKGSEIFIKKDLLSAIKLAENKY